MLKLYLYSYFNGIRSSRKPGRECSRNAELMWLLGCLKPDFKTIADFRKNNQEPIRKVFLKFSLICDEFGLLGKEVVAIDGSKFRASARLCKNTQSRFKTLFRPAYSSFFTVVSAKNGSKMPNMTTRRFAASGRKSVFTQPPAEAALRV